MPLANGNQQGRAAIATSIQLRGDRYEQSAFFFVLCCFDELVLNKIGDKSSGDVPVW